LKPRYKCRIFTYGNQIEYTDFAMASRQGGHDFDTITSQIK